MFKKIDFTRFISLRSFWSTTKLLICITGLVKGDSYQWYQGYLSIFINILIQMCIVFIYHFRCPNPRDSSVTIDIPTNNTNKVFVWHNQSFRFHGTSNELHFACDVLICVASNQDSACKRCGASGGIWRKRRSVSSSSSLISDDEHVMHKMTTNATPLKIISTPLF